MPRGTSELEFVDTVINVRYAETDQAGVVYYANYMVWFEVGRVAWCRAKGFHYRDMEREDGRVLVAAEVNCRYRAPAHFDDDVLIRTALVSANAKVMRFQYEILNHRTRQLLATGESAHVVTDRQFRPARLPKRYYSIFFGGPSRS